jgi:protocatechuate 3,4-dioxygenase beta subunit
MNTMANAPISRRTLLVAGGGAAIAGAAGITALRSFSGADNAKLAPVSYSFEDSNSCILTAAAEEGPFYVEEALIRRDIRDGRAGLLTALRMKVVDAATCAPLPGAAIDIWHCDAQGNYSAAPQLGRQTRDANGHLTPANTQRFCRGRQIADAGGMVEFTTIFPGWYPGRAPHIHLKAYLAERTAATSQLFFANDIAREIYATGIYAPHGQAQTTNDTDGVLAAAQGANGSWPKITRSGEGLSASLSLGIKRG